MNDRRMMNDKRYNVKKKKTLYLAKHAKIAKKKFLGFLGNCGK
jgi:hypothetical protein